MSTERIKEEAEGVQELAGVLGLLYLPLFQFVQREALKLKKGNFARGNSAQNEVKVMNELCRLTA